jgi:hypothetical protein
LRLPIAVDGGVHDAQKSVPLARRRARELRSPDSRLCCDLEGETA